MCSDGSHRSCSATRVSDRGSADCIPVKRKYISKCRQQTWRRDSPQSRESSQVGRRSPRSSVISNRAWPAWSSLSSRTGWAGIGSWSSVICCMRPSKVCNCATGRTGENDLSVVEKVCRSGSVCRRYRARALAIRHCPAIGLAALSVLLACHLWPFRHARHDHLLLHVSLHVHDLLFFCSCDGLLPRVRYHGLVTPDLSTACMPESVRQASD